MLATLVSLVFKALSSNNFFLFLRFLLLFKDAEFFPPLKIGHEIVAFNISLSRSPILELILSDFELLNDKDADGDRSDLAIVTSFSDCSYSSLEIIKFGLVVFEISIASFKSLGTVSYTHLTLPTNREV